MNDTLIYFVIAIIVFIAYKKYTQNRVLRRVPSLLKQGALIVDVRTESEFALANKPDSINIPLIFLATRVNELDKTKPIILCCASGTRSGIAKTLLVAKGFKNVHNAGKWNSLLEFY